MLCSSAVAATRLLKLHRHESQLPLHHVAVVHLPEGKAAEGMNTSSLENASSLIHHVPEGKAAEGMNTSAFGLSPALDLC